jgi:hypothetical protein
MSAVQLFVLGWALALAVIAFMVLARLVWTLYWIAKDYLKDVK